MHRSFIAVPLLALASLVLVACGDDKKSTDDGASRAATAVKGDAFCVQAAKVDGLITNMAKAYGDPTATEAAIKALVDGAARTEAVAPTDIVDTVRISLQGFRDLASGLEKFDWDLTAASADPEFLAAAQRPELDTAATTIKTYLSDKCGIEPS